MIKKIINFIFSHKIISLIALTVLIGVSYFIYQRIDNQEQDVQYVLAEVQRGSIAVSVSGSGQISSSDQVDIKPKISGDIEYIGVKMGQEITKGNLIFRIDNSKAQKIVRDAEIDLETAELELAKLLEPTDELDLLRMENDLAQARESKQGAGSDINQAYEDAFSDISNAFLDLPTIIARLRDIFYSKEIADSEMNCSNVNNISCLVNGIDYKDQNWLEKIINNGEDDYNLAREKYNQNLEVYQESSRYSSDQEIEILLELTINTIKAISGTIKSESNIFNSWTDYRSNDDKSIFSKVLIYQTELSSYTSQINSHLSSLLSTQSSLKNAEEDVLNVGRLIEELNLSYQSLKDGADQLDIRAKEINIQKAKDNLLDAKEDLQGHYIYAPFGGVVASLEIRNGESVSANTILASIITKQKIAEITLNEVDITKVEIAQKVILEFDAIEGLSITGEVVEIDVLGSVSQGIVSYNVKIVFDTEDERIRSGMSVIANIITDSRQKTLIIPISAVETRKDNLSFVTVLINDNFLERQVETGISNDISIEILTGLEQGDQVVVQMISSGEAFLNRRQNSSSGGNMMRMMR